MAQTGAIEVDVTVHAGKPCAHGWNGMDAERISTPCPACGSSSLVVGTGGHLTCSVLRCPQPGVEHEISRLKAVLRSSRATLLAISAQPHSTGRLWGESPTLRASIDAIDAALREGKPKDPLA